MASLPARVFYAGGVGDLLPVLVSAHCRRSWRPAKQTVASAKSDSVRADTRTGDENETASRSHPPAPAAPDVLSENPRIHRVVAPRQVFMGLIGLIGGARQRGGWESDAMSFSGAGELSAGPGAIRFSR